MMKRWIPVLAAAPFLVPATVVLAPRPFVRDVAHSQLNFIAGSQLLDAHGTFESCDAEIMFDAEKVEASSVVITIDSKSINTRVTQRDNHLKSNDFFATDSFPTITFRSAFINALAEDRINSTGDLTIRGRTKPITVPSRLVFFDAARNTGRVKGQTVIDRNDFGLSFQPSLNKISPEIQLQFDIAFKAKP